MIVLDCGRPAGTDTGSSTLKDWPILLYVQVESVAECKVEGKRRKRKQEEQGRLCMFVVDVVLFCLQPHTTAHVSPDHIHLHFVRSPCYFRIPDDA